jgi:glycosyltransferase involved in cell wall biosynthesis
MKHNSKSTSPIGRLILITAYDPHDSTKWSGTLHSIYQALEDQKGSWNFKCARGALGFFDLGARAINKALKWFAFNIDCRFSTAYALLVGAYVTIRFLLIKDCTFVTITSSNEMAYFMTRQPIIYISDATFRLICDLYPDFRAFPRWMRDQGDRNEARSLSKARFVIYPSRWASESARTHYGVPPEHIFEIPFGPNIPDNIISQYYVSKTMKAEEEIRFIFVSADWERKGGDIAIDICQLLIDKGHNVRLITVGSTPDHAKKRNFVDDRGFLSKSDPHQLAKICQAYREAHFLLLPSIADASPIVFSEAQAFGVPSIAYDVGGVGSAVLQDRTGLLLPLGASAEMFAKEITRYLRDPSGYAELSQNCRNRYLTQSNWHRWAKLIFQLARNSSDFSRPC